MGSAQEGNCMNAILQIRDGIAAAAVTGSGRSRSMTPRMRRDPPDVVTLDVMIRKVDGRSCWAS